MCVDRIYKLAYFFNAIDSTAFEAVRIMDRCLTCADPAKISFTMMSVLGVACFVMARKCMDDETPLNIGVLHYYTQNEMNEWYIAPENFNSILALSEIGILRATAEQPILPTPYDYINEALPEWPQMRNASLLIAAIVYAPESTIYTSMEIAAAAVTLAKKFDSPLSPVMDAIIACVPSVHLEELQCKMLWSLDRLFSLDIDSGFSRFYRDCKELWLDASQHKSVRNK